MTRAGRWTIATAGLLVAANLSLGTVPAISKGTARPSGGKAVAYTANGANAHTQAVAKTYSVTHEALEPTLGIDADGTIFYAAAGYTQAGGALPKTEIMRSENGGKSWVNSSPRIAGQDTQPISLDPYVWVDEDTGRVFTIDLTLACAYMSFSDDKGESWITNPLTCGRPVNDHQTLFSGPPVSTPMPVYPNILYYCYNDVASSQCTKSIDGGVSFHNTGSPAFAGYEPGSEDAGFYGQNGFCGGLHGHGAVGPDGSVYLPREYCGKTMLAISHDEGLTWSQVQVSNMRSPSQPTEGAPHPTVTVDDAGNIYYVFMGVDDRLPRLTVSTDGGETWSQPVIASPPGLKEANLPQIDAEKPGKIALVYYGSKNSNFPKCQPECEAKDYAKTTWNAYLTISTNALSSNPTFITGAASKDAEPLHRGRCGPGRCGWPYDFIDVEISPNGMAYAAFVDGCMSDCTIAPGQEFEGLVTTLVGAPTLR